VARGTERNRRARERREHLAANEAQAAVLAVRVNAALLELARRLTPATPVTSDVPDGASEAEIGLIQAALLADVLEGCVATAERLDIDLSREDPQ